jgi:protein-tyrosine phosphatase
MAVTPNQLNVAMVCTGNICRSPMAEVLAQHLVANDPLLSTRVLVTSAGTARWHVGHEMDPRARAALDRAGLRGPGSLATYADRAFLDAQNLVVAMSREHVRDVEGRLTNQRTSVILYRDLLERGLGLDVADPYYGTERDFDDCLALLSRAGPRLKEEFRQRLGASSPGV